MKYLTILMTAISIAACTKDLSKSSDLDKILEMHNNQRDYHFEKDSTAFVSQLSNNHIAVNRGVISQPLKKDLISRYNNYFSSVEFIKWDDLSDPIIRISKDGTMAYTVVDKLVRVTYKDSLGNKKEGETHFAWTAIYVKNGGDWEIDCVTSTNKEIDQ